MQFFSGLVLGCIEVDSMFDLTMGKAFQDSVYSFGDLECAETRYFFDQLLDEEWNLGLVMAPLTSLAALATPVLPVLAHDLVLRDRLVRREIDL